MPEAQDLPAMRDRLAELDAALVRAAAERARLGQAIAAAKEAQGLPTVDPAQERRVLDRARALAAEHGMDPEVAVDIVWRMVQANVHQQETARLRSQGTGTRSVVIGGAGRMGRWFVDFLVAQGHDVRVVDPTLDGSEPGDVTLAADLAEAELILVATPPRIVAQYYDAWSAAPPKALIADVASIKAPFLGSISTLQAAGARVGSLHPLFGPNATLLRGLDVLVCDTGDEEAATQLEGLFQSTTARVLRIGLDDHDRTMADLLARAHAAALAYAASAPNPDPAMELVPEGEPPLHSATQQAMERISRAVAAESPQVYFEIQSDNPYAPAAVARLEAALADLQKLVGEGNPAGFVKWMQDAHGDHDEAP